MLCAQSSYKLGWLPFAQRVDDTLQQTLELARQVPEFHEVTAEEIREINEDDRQSAEGIVEALQTEDNLEEQVVLHPLPEMFEQQKSMCSLSRILAAAESFKQIIIKEEAVRIREVEFCQELTPLMRHYTEEHSRRLHQSYKH